MTQFSEADVSEADATANFARLPFVSELRSAEALSNRLGFAVQPQRIRVKPGRSAIVAWQREDTSRLGEFDDRGWTAVVTDEDKLANIHRRADRLGERVSVHEASESGAAGTTGSVLLSGSVGSDPKLGREISRAVSHLRDTEEHRPAGGHGSDIEVTGYNPGRRVLLKNIPGPSSAPEFVRIGTGSQIHLVEVAAQWASWGLPTLSVESIGSRHTAVRSPWWGIGDLETHPDRSTAEKVGEIIAELHRHTPAEMTHQVRVSPMEQAMEVANVISQLLPELEGAVRDVVRRLESRLGRSGEAAERAIHGDLSPDQVLVGNSECRIIDLDRAGVGPTGMDLGRWLAACRRRGGTVAETHERAFLDGYLRAGGSEIDCEAWTAWALLVTALEPWRSCEVAWKQRTLQVIDDARSSLVQSTKKAMT